MFSSLSWHKKRNFNAVLVDGNSHSCNGVLWALAMPLNVHIKIKIWCLGEKRKSLCCSEFMCHHCKNNLLMHVDIHTPLIVVFSTSYFTIEQLFFSWKDIERTIKAVYSQYIFIRSVQLLKNKPRRVAYSHIVWKRQIRFSHLVYNQLVWHLSPQYYNHSCAVCVSPSLYCVLFNTLPPHRGRLRQI